MSEQLGSCVFWGCPGTGIVVKSVAQIVFVGACYCSPVPLDCFMIIRHVSPTSNYAPAVKGQAARRCGLKEEGQTRRTADMVLPDERELK